MKKTTYIMITVFLALSLFNCTNAKKEKIIKKQEPEKKIKTENKQLTKTNTVKLDFEKQPVKYMAKIFKCYHDWKIEKGIELSKDAIIIINKIFNKDPEQVIKDPALKLNKAYQIKSTLHTLKGMLHYRASLHSKNDPVRKENQAIMNKLKKGKEITDKDFEDLAEKIEKSSSSLKVIGKFSLAKNEFLLAIKTDKSNPSPHFHLAEILKISESEESKIKAEKHYYESARLSIEESNNKSIEKILEALKGLNPESAYIKKIEKMNKGIKSGIH